MLGNTEEVQALALHKFTPGRCTDGIKRFYLVHAQHDGQMRLCALFTFECFQYTIHRPGATTYSRGVNFSLLYLAITPCVLDG